MLDSVKKPFPDCIDYLVENIKLDPGFKEYFEWALAEGIPTVVVSSGMVPIIRAILKNLIGPDHDKLDIIANDVEAREGKSIDQEGGWKIKYHDESCVEPHYHPPWLYAMLTVHSDFGHDKSLSIRPYATLPAGQRPTMFYAGDGVSDLSAARETDLLFAKKGHDLIRYCAKENVPFTVFEDWSDILKVTKQIVAGEKSVQDAAHQGHQDFKNGKAGLQSNGAAR